MRLNQITFAVYDLAKACEFYLAMGFTQIVDTPHYARFECNDGGATFSLIPGKQPEMNNAVVYFECDELDQQVSRLVQMGIEFDEPPEDKRYLWREAKLTDPSGNRVILYHAGENRRFPPWRVERRGPGVLTDQLMKIAE